METIPLSSSELKGSGDLSCEAVSSPCESTETISAESLLPESTMKIYPHPQTKDSAYSLTNLFASWLPPWLWSEDSAADIKENSVEEESRNSPPRVASVSLLNYDDSSPTKLSKYEVQLEGGLLVSEEEYMKIIRPTAIDISHNKPHIESKKFKFSSIDGLNDFSLLPRR